MLKGALCALFACFLDKKEQLRSVLSPYQKGGQEVDSKLGEGVRYKERRVDSEMWVVSHSGWQSCQRVLTPL